MTSPQPAKTFSLSGMRGMIARHMMGSLSTTAQLTYFATANASHLVGTRKAWKEQGISIGYEDLILAVLCKTLQIHPTFNGVAQKDIVHLYSEICISVAIALADALVAPALSDLRGLSVPEICVLRRDIVARAQKGALTVTEMKSGTFTISNLGATRVEHFTPILNAGQIGLLGVGCITYQPAILDNGSISNQPQLGLSLTTDHRVVDGAPSAAFLTSLVEIIEKDLPLPDSH